MIKIENLTEHQVELLDAMWSIDKEDEYLEICMLECSHFFKSKDNWKTPLNRLFDMSLLIQIGCIPNLFEHCHAQAKQEIFFHFAQSFAQLKLRTNEYRGTPKLSSKNY